MSGMLRSCCCGGGTPCILCFDRPPDTLYATFSDIETEVCCPNMVWDEDDPAHVGVRDIWGTEINTTFPIHRIASEWNYCTWRSDLYEMTMTRYKYLDGPACAGEHLTSTPTFTDMCVTYTLYRHTPYESHCWVIFGHRWYSSAQIFHVFHNHLPGVAYGAQQTVCNDTHVLESDLTECGVDFPGYLMYGGEVSISITPPAMPAMAARPGLVPPDAAPSVIERAGLVLPGKRGNVARGDVVRGDVARGDVGTGGGATGGTPMLPNPRSSILDPANDVLERSGLELELGRRRAICATCEHRKQCGPNAWSCELVGAVCKYNALLARADARCPGGKWGVGEE